MSRLTNEQLAEIRKLLAEIERLDTAIKVREDYAKHLSKCISILTEGESR
jgi:hypothetical protein